MPNPNPNQAGLTPFKAATDEPIAKRAICTKFTLSQDAALRGMGLGDRSEFIRQAVADALAKLER